MTEVPEIEVRLDNAALLHLITLIDLSLEANVQPPTDATVEILKLRDKLATKRVEVLRMSL
jgi:hypothetical protein